MRISFLVVTILLVQTGYAFEWVTYYRGMVGDKEIEMTLFDCDTNDVLIGYQHVIGENTTTVLHGTGGEGDMELYQLEPLEGWHTYDTIGVYRGGYYPRKYLPGNWISADAKDTLSYSFQPGKSTQGASLTLDEDTAYRYFKNPAGDTFYAMVSEIGYVKMYGGKAEAINKTMFNYVRPDDTVAYPNYDQLADSWREFSYNISDTDFIFDYGYLKTENLDASCGINWNGSGVLCINFSYYEYTGGEHGSSGEQSYCFNLKSGNQLSLDDIFLNGYDTVLNHLTDSILGGESYLDSVNFNDDFCVSPEGISFNYDPYEIASYAGGSFFAFIPWSRVNAWIDPKGPMNWVRK